MRELFKMPWKPYECLLNLPKCKLLTNGSIPYFLCVSLNGFHTSNLSILNKSQYHLLKKAHSIKLEKLVRKSESYQRETVYFFLLFTFCLLPFSTHTLCTDHKCSVTLVCTKSIVYDSCNASNDILFVLFCVYFADYFLLLILNENNFKTFNCYLCDIFIQFSLLN